MSNSVLTLNGSVLVSNNSVVTADVGGSSSDVELESGVIFIDYDGTVIETWQTSEVASKSALPSNPTHSGLTSQGWNWTLADIKSYMSSYSSAVLTVGQNYVTSDGTTQIDTTLESDALHPYLGIYGVSSTSAWTVDWGDGSTSSSVSGSSTRWADHTYSTAGNYTIKITVTNGSIRLYSSSSSYCMMSNTNSFSNSFIYAQTVKNIRLGNNIDFGVNACTNLFNLETITIPNTVSMSGGISPQSSDGSCFYFCLSLKAVVIPSVVTHICYNLFNGCYSMKFVSIPKSIATVGYYNSNTDVSYGQMFSQCINLKYVAFPQGILSLPFNCFGSCYNLVNFIIPTTVTTIYGSCFNGAYKIKNIVMPNSITTLGPSTFYGCYLLQEVILPNSITTLSNSMFYTDRLLKHIIIPNTVTTIGNSVFNGCYSLMDITIPSSVTSIGTSAFSSCYSLTEIHFKSTTPPTIDSSNAFSSLPTTCTIYVPTGYLSAYTSASNYPSSLTYTYVEE